MSYIGLDIGITGTKAVVFSGTGEIIARAYDDYGKDYKNNLRTIKEIDPSHILAGVKRVLKGCRCSKLADAPKTIAVSVSGDDVFPADKDGNPLYNVIAAFSTKGFEYRDYIAEELGGINRIFDITGQRVDTDIAGLIRMVWMVKNIDGLIKDTWKFLCWESYINYYLCGNAVTDYSNASRYLIFDINKKQWSTEILEKMGIPSDTMPLAEPAGSIAGKVKKEVAAELDLPQDLVVVTGGFDQAAAALGAGVVRKGIFSVGLGTVIASHWMADCFSPEDTRDYVYCSYLGEDKYMGLLCSWNGNSVLNWFLDYIANLEKEKHENGVYDFFNSKITTGPSKLFFMPHLTGSAYPNYDPESRGAVIGLDMKTDKAEILKSVYEGTSFELMLNYKKLLEKTDISMDEIRAVGGGTRSRVWVQIMANIVGKVIKLPKIDEGGCLACAMLGAIAIGDFKDVGEACNNFVTVKDEIEPEGKNSALFREKLELYQNLYGDLKKYNHYLIKK
ncbi:MAG: FGGY-family carbohydrate kinase [Actinomycetota bacterium]